MKKLIINADDFGLHQEINKGIIKAFEEGVLTSTTLMCSAPAFEDAVSRALAHPDLGVGIHLTLVGGVAPVLSPDEVPSLVDKDGKFVENYVGLITNYYQGKVKKEEIYRELDAQIQRAFSTGIPITHIDSHQHMHTLPGITGIVVELCKKYKITKVRIPAENICASYGFDASLGRKIGRAGLSFCASLARGCFAREGIKSPDYFFGMLAGGSLSVPVVKNFLKGYNKGIAEIMTHPGSNAPELRKLFTWGYHWEQERDVYLNPEIKALIREEKIELINFGSV